MASDNNILVTKADLALSDLAANGGLLNPEQSSAFITKLLDQPTILTLARSIPMNGPSQKINKIGIGSRIMRAARQATTGNGRALTEAERSKPGFGQVELNTSEVIAEIRIPYEVLEDNIEKGNLAQTILDLVAERAALDFEELAILGNKTSGDTYLALQNGLLALLGTNTVDATDLGITKDVFNNALKALPTKYARYKSTMSFFASPNVEQDYRSALAGRGTSLGDDVLTGRTSVPVFGVPLRGASMMPDTKIVLMNPMNLIFGIQRGIRVESEKLISEREYKFVVTARVAVELEEAEAGVLVNNVGVKG